MKARASALRSSPALCLRLAECATAHARSSRAQAGGADAARTRRRRASRALTGAERDAIYDVLTRFFRGYLAGDTGALAYFVPPGTRPAATAGGFELVELASVGAVGPPARGRRLVLATVDARDVASGAVLALRYRVRMVHRDRWYVAELNRAGGAR